MKLYLHSLENIEKSGTLLVEGNKRLNKKLNEMELNKINFKCEICGKCFKTRPSLGSHKGHCGKDRVSPFSNRCVIEKCIASKAGKKYYKKKMKDILQNKVNFPTSKLKIRLFEEGYKEKRCEKCGQTSWLNELIPLELHHVDGNNKNNLIENLQILCPNCHALTDTYRGKNINRNPKKI